MSIVSRRSAGTREDLQYCKTVGGRIPAFYDRTVVYRISKLVHKTKTDGCEIAVERRTKVTRGRIHPQNMAIMVIAGITHTQGFLS